MAYTWVFDPDRSDGGVVVNAIANDMPEYKPGKKYRLELLFWHDRSLTDTSTGHTFGGPVGGTFGGPVGGTFGNSTIAGHIPRYEAVREYGDYTGRYATVRGLDGTVHVSDRTPSSAPIDSVIVALEPDGDDLPHTPGLWVALSDIDDATRIVDDLGRIRFRIEVLARRSDYATRSDLLNDIGVNI